jgi:hypothetical protein
MTLITLLLLAEAHCTPSWIYRFHSGGCNSEEKRNAEFEEFLPPFKVALTYPHQRGVKHEKTKAGDPPSPESRAPRLKVGFVPCPSASAKELVFFVIPRTLPLDLTFHEK